MVVNISWTREPFGEQRLTACPNDYIQAEKVINTLKNEWHSKGRSSKDFRLRIIMSYAYTDSVLTFVKDSEEMYSFSLWKN